MHHQSTGGILEETQVNYVIVLKRMNAPDRKSPEYSHFLLQLRDNAKKQLDAYPEITVDYASSLGHRLYAQSNRDYFENLFQIRLTPSKNSGYWTTTEEVKAPKSLENIIEMIYIPTPPIKL